MRADALGFFWEDRPVVKVAKPPPPKRVPPIPVWLEPGYIADRSELETALAFPVHVMTDDELLGLLAAGDQFVFDIEIYHNYFCICFISMTTGWVWYTEMQQGGQIDINRLGWIATNFPLIGFNSIGFDTPILSMALAGKDCAQMKEAANHLISEQWRPADVLKKYKVKSIKDRMNHVDLIEVAPGVGGSLKAYGGRMHCPRVQDLPFHHSAILTPEQMAIVRWYCVNDLTTTAFLTVNLKEQLDLRAAMSKEYGVDLRSKSDAQIAEAVIGEEVERLNGKRPQKPTIEVGTVYKYRVPYFLRYESGLMQWALGVIQNANFVVADHGSIEMPKEISELKLTIANATYQLGIGGLHSTEKRVAYVADADTVLLDRDVTSYYPAIILNLGLYPHHLGSNFLRVYKTIVDRRVHAKERGDKVVADSLKITVNGSFGKLGSKYSILYSPDLLIQVTITGQLALLMLIERLELRGITVVSANTDGVVIKCPRARRDELNAIVKQWECDTGFNTEESEYSAYFAKDVNNYIAVKKPDKSGKVGTKTKGLYAPTGLMKNPTTRICVDAVEALLTKNIPIHDTIRNCTDIRKFVSVRKVKGGAVKVYERLPPPPHNTKEELIQMAGFVLFAQDTWIMEGDSDKGARTTEAAYKAAVDQLSAPGRTQYLGVTIRWYYATGAQGEIIYATNGNKVPRSDGAKPMMDMPTTFPTDVNFEWYEAEANKILKEIAYLQD